MADVLRSLFFPALVAGIVCVLLWRRLPDRNRRVSLLLVGAGLFTVPQFLVVIAGTMATELVLYRQVVLAIWLTLFGLFAAWRVIRVLEGHPLPARGKGSNSPLIMGLLALMFGGFGVYMAALSAEDLLLPRQIFQGGVTRKWVTHGTRSAPQYYLGLGGRSVQVGRDLYVRVQPGETVRLEVTAASHTVVKAYRVVPAY